jgi:hypothetical protein
MYAVFIGLGVLSKSRLWYSIYHDMGDCVCPCLFLVECDHRFSAESAYMGGDGSHRHHFFSY